MAKMTRLCQLTTMCHVTHFSLFCWQLIDAFLFVIVQSSDKTKMKGWIFCVIWTINRGKK